MPIRPHAPLGLVVLALLVAGCGGDPTDRTPRGPATTAPPLPAGPSAYEVAGGTELPAAEPEESEGLHNVFHLSENIVSGSEPHGEEAMKRIAEMGVKTVLSVDGKVPDHEMAAKHGLRYVHVPIQYSGITASERLRIAKVFREMEGPFYVHCFHGKHRGPAAAAVGRVVLDGAPREQAVAEMRQWCGTSGKYGGLYEVIARAPMPSPAETASFAWSFPAAEELGGFRHAMIEVSRIHDHIQALADRDWEVDPSHPDLSAENEAAQLAQVFGATVALDDVLSRPDDFRRWTRESHEHAEALLAALKAGDGAAAREAFAAVRARCDDCHKVYRNPAQAAE